MGSPFAKKHRCRLAVICHCLLPARSKFFPCCGYYCHECEGRINRCIEAGKHVGASSTGSGSPGKTGGG